MTRLRAASLSRNIRTEPPTLVHSLLRQHSSVLSLAVDGRHIYSGSQASDICVWSVDTFTLKTCLRGHTGSVLALEYAPDREWLFSSSGDSTIRIWCTRTLRLLYVLTPYMESDAGDIFSLAWSPPHQTIYFGCQNTSLQWYTFSPPSSTPFLPLAPAILHSESTSRPESGRSTPTFSKKAHKFFDSYPRFQRRPADTHASNNVILGLHDHDGHIRTDQPQSPQEYLYVDAANVIDSAHYGYVYCMALLPSVREGCDVPPTPRSPKNNVRLVTGSGDETLKLWHLNESGRPELNHAVECDHGAVLSLCTRGDLIYAGCQEGYVKVWDPQTKTLVRTIIVQENVDVLSLSMMHGDLYTFSANGQIKRYSDTFDCTASWAAHAGIVLSSVVYEDRTYKDWRLVSGGNDDAIHVWKIIPPEASENKQTPVKSSGNGWGSSDDEDLDTDAPNDVLVYALSKFVSIPSVSSEAIHREDCRQAAIWLTKCLHQLGATSKSLYTNDVHNPIVFAKFEGSQTQSRKPRILFYGHYDVISAPSEYWDSPPFRLTSRNGFLYGRGVADDKGPVLSVACAAAELIKRRQLGCDLVMLVEGEEEAGSVGFEDTVKKYKDLIGDIDAILVSNSTWISSDTPCITYGLRGVVHCNVEITSGGKDAHSGIEGGVLAEPMQDMIQLLSTLTDRSRKVLVPGFYDRVQPQNDEEKMNFILLESVTQTPASSLAARWREPSLTIHNIEGSGPRNPTVIPAMVKAQVSVRIVPDQDLETVAGALRKYLEDSFAEMKSSNKLNATVDHAADWWLGNLNHPWFKALEGAITEEWGMEPLRIREGGSIPSVPFLEKEFNCPALHLPMAQCAAQAHLPNERMSLINLRRGQSVVERFLLSVADAGVPSEKTVPEA